MLSTISHAGLRMSNVVRLEKEKERAQKETNVAIVASDIEFVRLVRGHSRLGMFST